MKAGEGNPQAREEEGKLSLLSTRRSSSLAGIPRMWGLEFCGVNNPHKISSVCAIHVEIERSCSKRNRTLLRFLVSPRLNQKKII